MFSKEREILSVTLDENTLRLAQVRLSADAVRVLGVAKGVVRDVPEEEIPAVIRGVLGELHIKRASAICTIPPANVITKNIEIPSLDPEEIRSIIDLQAGRHTPFAREEILVGYITIGVFQRNYTKVLLIIVNREVVKKQLGLFDSAGIKVEKVLFAPEAVARFYAQGLNVKPEEPPVGVIDIDQHGTSFVVEFNQTVAMTRHIPIGMSQLIKEGPEAQDKLVAELLQSVEAYQNEDINILPEQYLLTSDDAKMQELQPVLQEKMRANLKIMPYLDMIQAAQPVMLRLVSEYNDDSFLSLIAAAATLDQLQVDLTPDEIKTQRALEEKGRQLIKTLVYGLVVVLLVIVVFISKVYFRNVYLDRLRADYQEKRKRVIALDRLAQKTRIVKGYLSGRMVGLEVLSTLYSLVPEEIYLQTIMMDENGSVDIVGISESMSRVFNFVTALEDSELFKNVKTKSTTARKDRGKDVAAFEITFKLEWASDEDVVPLADEVMAGAEPAAAE